MDFVFDNDRDIAEEKAQLRSLIKERFENLDQYYLSKADKEIENYICNLKAYKQAGTVLLFASTKGEPETGGIIADALERKKRVAMPRCLENGEMEAVLIKSKDDLVPGKYGILEPKEGLPVIPKEEIKFALIPCVTCDDEGNRLGHGEGYYDRFLEDTVFFTCMICYCKLMTNDIPVDEHDHPIDLVVYDDEEIDAESLFMMQC